MLRSHRSSMTGHPESEAGRHHDYFFRKMSTQRVKGLRDESLVWGLPCEDLHSPLNEVIEQESDG